MAQLVLSRGANYNKSIFGRLMKKASAIELGPYFLVVSLIVFVALTVVITLMFSARQVTKGYVLNSLEADHQVLVKVSETKDMQISEVKSLNYIQDSSKVASMVNPGQVVFLHGDSTIAKK